MDAAAVTYIEVEKFYAYVDESLIALFVLVNIQAFCYQQKQLDKSYWR